jgi:hypothetical protein
MKDDAADTRNATAGATSSGRPTRPAGIERANRAGS